MTRTCSNSASGHLGMCPPRFHQSSPSVHFYAGGFLACSARVNPNPSQAGGCEVPEETFPQPRAQAKMGKFPGCVSLVSVSLSSTTCSGWRCSFTLRDREFYAGASASLQTAWPKAWQPLNSKVLSLGKDYQGPQFEATSAIWAGEISHALF